MAVAKFSRKAIRDLKQIWRFIANESESETIADRFVESVSDKAAQFADHPLIGIPRDDLKLGLRLFPIGNYLVFYRLKNWGIDVVRVIHGSRDLRRQWRP